MQDLLHLSKEYYGIFSLICLPDKNGRSIRKITEHTWGRWFGKWMDDLEIESNVTYLKQGIQ